jgi:hypothetical protein
MLSAHSISICIENMTRRSIGRWPSSLRRSSKGTQVICAVVQLLGCGLISFNPCSSRPQTPFDHTTPRSNDYAFLHQARDQEALLYMEILLLCRAGVQLLFGGARPHSRRCEVRQPSSTTTNTLAAPTHQMHMQAGCRCWIHRRGRTVPSAGRRKAV